MSRLHKTLEALGPRDFSDIPLETLSTFLHETFTAAEEIANSVPRNGEVSTQNLQAKTPVGRVMSASDMVSLHHHAPPDDTNQENAKGWGRPIKLGPKDNPLGLSIYKMAAHDRHGAWFARRSIHKGMPFDQWKRAMQKEFVESMKVGGGPGAGSIRGIGADRRLEKRVIDGVGTLEVWHLSAQFPGPTAPRDFVVCLLTSDINEEQRTGKEEDHSKPKQYIVVSIPIEHPDAPLKDGLVRGQYESVEIIRQVKGWDQKSKSTEMLHTSEELEKHGRDRGHTIGFAESRGIYARGEDIDRNEHGLPESDLVEWIMITRSDPGGGIPRFMVERGTPSSIANDAVKFLDWAAQHSSPDSDAESSQTSITCAEDEMEVLYPIKSSRSMSDGSTFEPSNATDTGVIASLTSVVRDGFDKYAPGVQESIANLLTTPNNDNDNDDEEEDDDDDESDTTSINSFASAKQFTSTEDVNATPAFRDLLRPSDALSSSASSIDSSKTQESGLDQKLAKLEERRKALDSGFDKAAQREEIKAKEALTKEAKEAAKIKERLEREKKKREEKYAKELRKLEEKRRQEERKAEERRKKVVERDLVTQVKRERDQARRMAEVLRQENEILRDRVGELQRENTMIVQKISKLSGGRELLREIKMLASSDGRDSSKNGHIRNRSASPTSGSSRSSINSGTKASIVNVAAS